jgi:hypothetical protein
MLTASMCGSAIKSLPLNFCRPGRLCPGRRIFRSLLSRPTVQRTSRPPIKMPALVGGAGKSVLRLGSSLVGMTIQWCAARRGGVNGGKHVFPYGARPHSKKW